MEDHDKREQHLHVVTHKEGAPQERQKVIESSGTTQVSGETSSDLPKTGQDSNISEELTHGRPIALFKIK